MKEPPAQIFIVERSRGRSRSSLPSSHFGGFGSDLGFDAIAQDRYEDASSEARQRRYGTVVRGISNAGCSG